MRSTFYRDAFPAVLLGLIFFILITVLFVNPGNVPIPVRGLDAWARANWTVFIWIMAGIGIADFVLSSTRFQMGTSKRLEALEKRVAELEDNLRDLDRKT